MSETNPKLGRDVFMALAAIGWADGNLDQEEADAIVRTALDEGFSIEDIEEIEAATKTPIRMSDVDLGKMSKEDRLFVYAVAVWMSRIDGVLTDDEVVALKELGELLKIPEKPLQHAEAIALEVAGSADGKGVVDFDLPRVRKTIHERLAEARRLRAEAGAEAPKD